MPYEQKYTGLIIKMTPYGEADEIITVFTRELGKVRVIAKSVKRPSSKLAHVLQPLFLIELIVVGNETLPKVIHARIMQVFRGIAGDPEKVAIWFVVAELLQKSLPDAQKNEELFVFLEQYLHFLEISDVGDAEQDASVAAMKLGLLDRIGLAVHMPKGVPTWFSIEHGGFYSGDRLADSVAVTPGIWELFLRLRKWNGTDRLLIPQEELRDVRTLSHIITRFVHYQLEREIKADRFLSSKMV